MANIRTMQDDLSKLQTTQKPAHPLIKAKKPEKTPPPTSNIPEPAELRKEPLGEPKIPIPGSLTPLKPSPEIEEEPEPEELKAKPSLPRQLTRLKPSPIIHKPKISILAKSIGAFLLILFLLGLISFTYWLFFVKEKPPAQGGSVLCPQIITPAKNPLTGECISFPTPCDVPVGWEGVEKCGMETKNIIEEPKTPLNLIPSPPPTSTKIIEITSKNDLPLKLEEIIKQKHPENEFTRILIKLVQPAKAAEYLDFPQFLEFMDITVPEAVLSSLADNFTLFIRPQNEGNRLGLLLETKNKEELRISVRDWELTMEENWKNFFQFWGKSSSLPNFREINWQGVPLRYLVYEAGLGINYAITNSYFLFTSSGDSIHSLIKILVNRL